MEEKHSQVPHVLMLPFPAQGHVKPMLTLAKLLCHAGLHVTLVNTHHNHTLLNSNLQALSTWFPTLHFESISDGLPPDHPRTLLRLPDMFSSINSVTKPLFRELLIESIHNHQDGHDRRPPLTCIIADGIMSFAIDVAEEFGIPVITFRTFSACCLWFYLCLPKLIDDGDLPFQDEDLDKKFTSVPGMEDLLRRRDLPGICRLKVVNSPVLQFFVNETLTMTRASSLILNTFDDLEAPILSRIASVFPKTYTIGPLSSLLKSQIKDPSSSTSNATLLKEDRDCMTWLDSQPSRSTMYVSFGSLAIMTRVQLLEIWYGLVNSGKRFLWVIRSDSINGDGEEEQGTQIPKELEVGTKERGLMVDWAPQEEVLGCKWVSDP